MYLANAMEQEWEETSAYMFMRENTDEIIDSLFITVEMSWQQTDGRGGRQQRKVEDKGGGRQTQGGEANADYEIERRDSN